jgi:hypothetical protein
VQLELKARVTKGKMKRAARARVTYRSGVRCDGAGDEHHVKGDDDLDDEGVPVRPRRRGGADHIDGVQHRLEHERRAHRASELRRPVERHLQTIPSSPDY